MIPDPAEEDRGHAWQLDAPRVSAVVALPSSGAVAAGIGVRGAIVAESDVVADRGQKQAFSVAWVVAFAASAVVGFDRVRRCRKAVEVRRE